MKLAILIFIIGFGASASPFTVYEVGDCATEKVRFYSGPDRVIEIDDYDQYIAGSGYEHDNLVVICKNGQGMLVGPLEDFNKNKLIRVDIGSRV